MITTTLWKLHDFILLNLFSDALLQSLNALVVNTVADGPVRLLTPSMSPFLYCLGALRALVIVIASGRDCHVTADPRKSREI